MALNTDSSPFQSSPMESTTSPRLFWQSRGFNSENSPYSVRSGSPSPTRRSSIERLQKASRVKNSNILALEQKQEYDPTRLPNIERPLAKVQPNAYGGAGATADASGLRSEARKLGHQRSESKNNIPFFSPPKSASTTAPVAIASASGPRPPTPSKDQSSPTKSSLSSRFKSSFDPETGAWSAGSSYDERELPDGKSLHRHAKSVTFDAAPPQINEYEMATPDLSSIGSNSREGSYDSIDDDDDDHYMMRDDHGHEDSFDASLEDTDKTPVVGPDDWRHDGQEERYENSPMPDDAHPVGRPEHHRTDSTTSNGDHRPLPPLPGMGPGQLTRSHSSSSNGLSATAERMLGAHRSLPSPPPAATTKSEIQNIGNGKMTLEERLRLMMLSDDGKSAAEQQRERRMRRAATRERTGSQTPERERDPSSQPEDGEEDDTIGDLSCLEEYQLPPRISRESIMRRVNGNNLLDRESDYHFSSPPPSSSPERHHPMHYDPDVPIPSTEDPVSDFDDDDDGSVIVTRNHDDKDVDVYSIPDMYQDSETLDDDRDVSIDRNDHDNDSESQYSDQEQGPARTSQESEEDQVPTPRAGTPVESAPVQKQPTAVKASLELNGGSKENDFTKGLESFMLARPEEPEMASEPEKPKMADAQAYLQRPFTPEQKITRSLTHPDYDGSGWGEPEDEDQEPGTPDSVIHHPMSYSEEEDEEEEQELPAIPEKVATIKSASGSKLKTRPSATPSDIMAMREARRHVSREVPPIPERHRNRMSRDMEPELTESTASDDFLERHPSFKKRSLTLDLDLGLSLDKDFERVIEAQKVATHQFLYGHSPPKTSTTDTATDFQSRQASQQKESDQFTSAANTDHDTNMTPRKKRGYLMRQNTKLVTASDKETDDLRGGYRSAGNSPIKATRPQSWTVEPWNGQPRKRSSVRKPRPATGAVPPLPGQESNAMALNPLNEEDLTAEMSTGESGERGRLFVKVMGVKDLDLPIPRSKLECCV